MPKRQRKQRGRRPNVFVQTSKPTGRENATEVDQTVSEPSPVLAATATVQNQQPARTRRSQSTRSDVYARTFPREIRKMGILAAGVAVALAAFTVIL